MQLTHVEQLAASAAAEGPIAGGEACRSAVAALAGPPALVLAFPSGSEDPTADASAAATAAGAPVAGISGAGAIGPDGLVERGCAAIAFGAPLRAGVGVARNASRDLRIASAEAAATALEGAAADHSILLLFLDTRSGDQSDAIAGAYRVSGPRMPFAGGAAGGPEPFLMANGEALSDAVVAVALGSPEPIGVGVAHACELGRVPAMVTRSEGRVLRELDGRLAEEVYLERLGRPAARLDDEEFERFAVTHPLAQPALNGDVRLRHVLGRAEGGALRCATHIPADAAVEFTVERPEQIVRSTWEAVSGAVESLDGSAVRAALVFDCAGRKRALGGAVDEELAALTGSFGSGLPPIGGLYTHGEVGRVRGAKGDRNHAIVVAAFG